MELERDILRKDRAYLMEHVQDSIDIHTHDYYEMVYIEDGSIYHYFQDKKFKVHKGDYFIINISDRHGYERIEGVDCHLYNFLFYPEFIDSSMKQCKNFSAFIENYLIKFDQSILKYNPTTYIFRDDDGEILKILEKLNSEEEEKTYGYTEIMRCNLIEILIKTMRKIVNEETVSVKDSPTQFLIKYIEDNYSSKVSLSELSKELNYSLPYISLKFKEETGFLFTEYLQKYRVEQAVRILANTDKKVSEIAQLVGYEDTKFFVEIFKKYMHITPQKFRKQRV